jgi:hypothetical protein
MRSSTSQRRSSKVPDVLSLIAGLQSEGRSAVSRELRSSEKPSARTLECWQVIGSERCPIAQGRRFVFPHGRRSAYSAPSDILMSSQPDDGHSEEGELVPRDRAQALVEDVYSQLYSVHVLWRMWVTFFSRDAIDVVRRDTVFTFGVIQQLLYKGIILGLDQLLELPVTKGNRHHASMGRLVLDLPASRTDVAREARKRLRTLRKECAAITEWRDVIAHRDVDVALEMRVLDEVKVRTVRLALLELTSIFNSISHVHDINLLCTLDPDEDPSPFDAPVLIERLRRTNAPG